MSKAVGNAVTRNRVKRRLRHLAAAASLPSTPFRVDVVVRALPAAATGARWPTTSRRRWGSAAPACAAEGCGMKYVLIGLLKVYRAVISPLYGDVCKFHPTCSAYALDAIHGLPTGPSSGTGAHP